MTGASGGSTDRPLPAELARLLHDLRGPLNSAVIHLEVLKRTVADDPAAAGSLRTVLQQLARLSEMLPAALGVAALEPDPPRTHDLRALVERACQAGGHAGVTLTTGSWPCVTGDEALLVRAIGELIANAVEATPAGSPPFWTSLMASMRNRRTATIWLSPRPRCSFSRSDRKLLRPGKSRIG